MPEVWSHDDIHSSLNNGITMTNKTKKVKAWAYVTKGSIVYIQTGKKPKPILGRLYGYPVYMSGTPVECTITYSLPKPNQKKK